MIWSKCNAAAAQRALLATSEPWRNLGFAPLGRARNGSSRQEKDLIYPMLSAIGWGDLVFVQPNASAKGRGDVPDALLFADEAALAMAKREPEDFRRFALPHTRRLVKSLAPGVPVITFGTRAMPATGAMSRMKLKLSLA